MALEGTLSELQAELERIKKEAIDATKDAVRILTRELMDRTPVWSGKTVRNYAWGLDRAPGGGQIEPIGGPGYVPARAGGNRKSQREQNPGPTNSMPLPDGEPRRAANEQAALAEMENVLAGMTELRSPVVTNFSDIWDLVDNGSAPTPQRARNPGGVSILAEQAAKAKMGGKLG
jgi:hypothetical protein